MNDRQIETLEKVRKTLNDLRMNLVTGFSPVIFELDQIIKEQKQINYGSYESRK